MTVDISLFGEVLLSRPAGREAFLKAKAYIFSGFQRGDEIVLDFEKVKVLTPSWADEFISGIKTEYAPVLRYEHTGNPSVEASLRFVT